jgi:hypothetical protein
VEDLLVVFFSLNHLRGKSFSVHLKFNREESENEGVEKPNFVTTTG